MEDESVSVICDSYGIGVGISGCHLIYNALSWGVIFMTEEERRGKVEGVEGEEGHEVMFSPFLLSPPPPCVRSSVLILVR